MLGNRITILVALLRMHANRLIRSRTTRAGRIRRRLRLMIYLSRRRLSLNKIPITLLNVLNLKPMRRRRAPRLNRFARSLNNSNRSLNESRNSARPNRSRISRNLSSRNSRLNHSSKRLCNSSRLRSSARLNHSIISLNNSLRSNMRSLNNSPPKITGKRQATIRLTRRWRGKSLNMHRHSVLIRRVPNI